MEILRYWSLRGVAGLTSHVCAWTLGQRTTHTHNSAKPLCRWGCFFHLYQGSAQWERVLQIAVDAGQSGVARLLLKAAQEAGMHKSIANHIDDTKSAPLHVAARYGDHKCLLILLEVRGPC